jgi:hypothetical protein
MRLEGELASDQPVNGDGVENRRAARAPTRLEAPLRRREGRPAKAIVLDLSVHGFRAETTGLFAPGTQVWLKLPGLEASLATVAWTDQIQIGAEFVQPLHPAVADRIVAQAGGA